MSRFRKVLEHKSTASNCKFEVQLSEIEIDTSMRKSKMARHNIGNAARRPTSLSYADGVVLWQQATDVAKWRPRFA
ncbi:hypothetical protein PoB_007328800 [Plakobranchus ocellatus]|uniref:Uncharacterized protein n=1 Tax=Plakobranchus ocellatus TaxID=259542 RepID=A0AAV4DR44_9GAST|nr:hypothetical protein PoB_007328800 [Plakobranchus ocellatus]